ncbi:hypothetical protein GCM10010302_44120 [Streptomyces polychromogenes]|uniref:Cytochrome P450 n=1 Tax=Streptomyces polychromogenes TaxID=67342 RepID=A0ABP3F5Y0_9ACTN
MGPWVRERVDALLSAMEAEGPGADVALHLADRLPLETICELLEIPAGDRPRLRGRAVAMMTMAPEARDAAVTARQELRDAELAVLAQLLMVSGHDTTTYDISNIVYTLLTHPAHLARLQAHPARPRT